MVLIFLVPSTFTGTHHLLSSSTFIRILQIFNIYSHLLPYTLTFTSSTSTHQTPSSVKMSDYISTLTKNLPHDIVKFLLAAICCVLSGKLGGLLALQVDRFFCKGPLQLTLFPSLFLLLPPLLLEQHPLNITSSLLYASPLDNPSFSLFPFLLSLL